MKNYLLPALNSYFIEILAIESKLSVSTSFLIAKKKDIINENRRYKMIHSQITSYRDLSHIQGGDNLFTPKFSYEMHVDNLENEIGDIISQQSCFAVSQAYEIFESFLIEILTDYLGHNQQTLQDLKLKNSRLILLKETIREIVKREQRSNNKGLLSLIRKCSSHFKNYENRNIYKVNISQWFDLVSMIRHNLVHNRQIVSPRFLKYLQTHKANAMFDRHFKRKRIGENICIFLEQTTASDIINWLNTFAHFIFVSLSMEAGLSLKIPQYVAGPPINFPKII